MSQEVLHEVLGGVGVITLHRPQAMNALSLTMVREIIQLLQAWESDPDVHGVLLQGAAREAKGGQPGSVHFCAGGDIRFLFEAGSAGDPNVEAFFTEEYALDHRLHTYPKPVVAWLDGVVMGGGMGLAQAARLRVATGRVRMAMPETRIGLFPDVGGGFFLSRCLGAMGEYLGVVGAQVCAADALALGLADVVVGDGALPALLQGLRQQPLAAPGDLLPRVRACARSHPLASLAQPVIAPHLAAIDHHFSQPSLQGIEASLLADDSDWARDTLAHMANNSPLMMAVTLAQIRHARGMALADVFRMERTIVHRCFEPREGGTCEVLEGIRALVIDKDHAPAWRPSTIAEVTDEMVERHFVPVWSAAAHPLSTLN